MQGLPFKSFFDIPHNVTVRFNVTNACNLHCTYCDNDAHLPFRRNGQLYHRRYPIIAKKNEIELFCELMTGVGESDMHLMTGGEFTILPMSIIYDYINTLQSFGRRIGMRTNGYNLHSIAPEKLKLIDLIYLNSHGINSEAINVSLDYLDKNFQGKIILEETLQHRNLREVINHGKGSIEHGMNCNHLLATLTVLSSVVLPCCNTWALMNSLNSKEMLSLLINAGWTVHNPNLKETLQHWKCTLPQAFLKNFCANSCYITNPDSIPLYPIQQHPQDRVLKGTPTIPRS